MKTEKLPLIGLERFKSHPEHISYMDNDIAVIDSISEMLELDEDAVKLDCFMVIFCQEGNIMVTINGQEYRLEKDYCAILPPGSIIRRIMPCHPYTLNIAAASKSFLSEILTSTKEDWTIMHYLYYHPIYPVRPTASYKMYLYKELLIKLIQEEPHVYSQQTRRFHFAGMFCEMMALLKQIIPEHELSDKNRTRSTIIARDFIQMVNADNGSHRSVSYYADRLFYSAKYLSSTIKQVTGKTPIQIINEHAVKEIKHKLKYTDMSIKEIADYFDFPNPSFFGKYVKIHLGMTPLQCRFAEEEK